jgi:hypothetical protein
MPLSFGLMWLGFEDHNWTQTSAKVIVAWCLIKHRLTFHVVLLTGASVLILNAKGYWCTESIHIDCKHWLTDRYIHTFHHSVGPAACTFCVRWWSPVPINRTTNDSNVNNPGLSLWWAREMKHPFPVSPSTEKATQGQRHAWTCTWNSHLINEMPYKF